MAKNDNLTDFLTDVADAIREKKGTTEKINPQEFSNEIASIKTSSSIWTGHVDVEGLKAIGWDDNDIAYYQEHGVNWDEEDDEYHKVPEDNKALYGVINYSNYKDYKDIIVYLPKFDMSAASGYELFYDFRKMVGLPMLKLTLSSCYYTFGLCYSLPYLIPIEIANTTEMVSTFRYCYALKYIPFINTERIRRFLYTFDLCVTLNHIPRLSYKSATEMSHTFSNCFSLNSVVIDSAPLVDATNILRYSYGLEHVKLSNINSNLVLDTNRAISKASILYIINNEAAESAITITLHANAYARLATDPDILAALANHPLVSLASV